MREFKKIKLSPKKRDTFVFVWIRKELFAEVMMHFDRQGYNYMENVSWIELNSNTTAHQEADKDRVNDLVLSSESEGIFKSAHDTFLVFRTKKQEKHGDSLDMAL